jgi:LacI family transcriptional regulator
VQLRDVAAEAGVSVSTASRVLAGAGRVSPEAERSVTAAAARLGYRPNRIARALREQRTATVGMIVPLVRNPFYADLVAAVDSFLQEAGFDLVLADSVGSPDNEARRLESLVERQVDGLLVIPASYRTSTAAIARAAASVPIVQLERRVAGFAGDYVGVDNREGIRMVLDHVLGEGARRVVFASSTPTHSAGHSRLQAFRAEAKRHPHVVVDDPVLGQFTLPFGRQAATAIVSRGDLPDAIVCGSDLIALGLISQLRELGVAVPGDVLVTGFDDNFVADLADPPLTTVHQPVRRIAREGVTRLVGRITGELVGEETIEMAPRLVVRRSSVRDLVGVPG